MLDTINTINHSTIKWVHCKVSIIILLEHLVGIFGTAIHSFENMFYCFKQAVENLCTCHEKSS